MNTPLIAKEKVALIIAHLSAHVENRTVENWHCRAALRMIDTSPLDADQREVIRRVLLRNGTAFPPTVIVEITQRFMDASTGEDVDGHPCGPASLQELDQILHKLNERP